MTREAYVRITFQIALLGEVSSKLRRIYVTYDDESMHFDCYFDGPVSEEDWESMSCVDTEIVAGCPPSHRVTHRTIQCDFPEQIPGQEGEICVYARREDDMY